ncbi:MAG: ABC transporter substrate-binding protein [Betaproteobacteria bacterium]|nr:ABC transporter substrate-binding protein [Betaproteobacteria bacterium]
MQKIGVLAAGWVLMGVALLANAEIVIGVSVSGTGPGAALGIPVRNTIELLPKTIAGEAIRYVVLDDASDPAAGNKIVRQFATESRADVIMGSSSVPVAVAQSAAVTEVRVPMIALCPIPLDPAKMPFVFAVPQSAQMMVAAMVEHMKANGAKSVGFIGFSDAWGDLTLRALTNEAGPAGIRITAQERFARTDTSVNAQVIKVMATNPDVMFLGDAGTPGALPHVTLIERGYKGKIYHSHGVVGKDFIRVGGKNVEGGYAATGSIVVADQLPDSSPLKAVGVEFIKRYEAVYGAGSRNAFAGYAYDAYLVIAAAIPAALKKAKPGTPEFRQAMRESIESVREVVGTHAIYNMSATDHNGIDKRARVLVQVANGDWQLVK